MHRATESMGCVGPQSPWDAWGALSLSLRVRTRRAEGGEELESSDSYVHANVMANVHAHVRAHVHAQQHANAGTRLVKGSRAVLSPCSHGKKGLQAPSSIKNRRLADDLPCFACLLAHAEYSYQSSASRRNWLVLRSEVAQVGIPVRVTLATNVLRSTPYRGSR